MQRSLADEPFQATVQALLETRRWCVSSQFVGVKWFRITCQKISQRCIS